MTRITCRVSVNKGLVCEFVFDGTHLTCIWDPEPPTKLTAKMLRRYCARRDEFLQRVSREIGGSVLLLEPPAGNDVQRELSNIRQLIERPAAGSA